MKIYVLLLILLLPSALLSQWIDLASGIPGDLKAITYLQNDSTLYTVGEPGIYKTTNYGQTWSKVHIASNPTDSLVMEYTQFTDIIVNGTNMFAVGRDTVNDNGVIFRYSTVSALWNLSHSVPGGSFNAIGIANTFVIAVGDNGLVRRSSTGGAFWGVITTVIPEDLYDVSGNTTTAYIGGDGVIYRASGTFSAWSVCSFLTMKSLVVENNGEVHGVNDTQRIRGTDFMWQVVETFTTLGPRCLEFQQNFSTTHVAYMGTDSGIYGSIEDMEFYEFCESSAGYGINGFEFIFDVWNNPLGYAVGDNGLVLKSINVGADQQPYIAFGLDGGCSDSTISFINDGPVSYDYTWNLNGLNFSNNFDADSILSTPGMYEIMLIGTNDNDTDSLSKIFYVTDLPDTAKNYSISDEVICHVGSSDITIHLSDLTSEYRLIKLPDYDTVDFQMGTGSDAILNTGMLTDSSQFIIDVRSINADCSIYFSDTILIGVENTIASFHATNINAELNQNIHFYNNSHHADFYEWDFGNGSFPTLSTDVEADVFYSVIGIPVVKLIASTANGCTDTLILTSTQIYDPLTVVDNCWALNFSGYDTTFIYSHDHANGMALSKSGNIIVCGSNSYCNFNSKTGLESYDYSYGFYIASYTEYGVLNWVVRGVDLVPQINISDYNNYSAAGSAFDVSIDEDNSILVSGWANNDFMLHSNDGKDILLDDLHYIKGAYIMKLDSNGAFIWKAAMQNSIPSEICTDSSKNVYVSGYYNSATGVVDSQGSSNSFPVPDDPYGSVYLLKLNSDGLFSWVVQVSGGTTSYSKIADIDVNASGDIFLVGQHAADLVLNSTSGSALVLDYPPGIQPNGFIARYSTDGIPQWGHSINSYGTGVNYDKLENVAVAESGNIYVSVNSNSTAAGHQVIYPSSGQPNESYSYGAYALASYLSDGTLRWVTGVNYAPSTYGNQVALDESENVYTAGVLNSNTPTTGFMMSAGQPTPSIQLPIEGNTFYISKYDLDGKIIWATLNNGMISTPGFNVLLTELAVDENQNVYVCGQEGGTFYNTFYLAQDTLNTLGQDGFIARYSSSACLQPDQLEVLSPSIWYCFGDSIAIPFNLASGLTSNSGNVYSLELSGSNGLFTAPVIIGTLNSIESSDTIYGIIPSVSLPGNYKVRVLASDPMLTGNEVSITIKPASGPFNPHFETLNICQGETVPLAAAGSGYSVIWTPSTYLNYYAISSPQATPDTTITYISEVLDYCGYSSDTIHIIVSPSYLIDLPLVQICEGDTISIFGNDQTDDAVYQDVYTTSAGCDSIMQQQLSYYPSYFFDAGIITICSGDSLEIFGVYQNQNGVWYDSYTTINGCDSTYAMGLQLVEATISYNSGTLFGGPVGYNYKWLDCNNFYAAIPGATSINFTPTTNGSYALLMYQGGCSDTSDCFSVNDLDLAENTVNSIKVSPNPTSGRLNIELTNPSEIITVVIYSVQGEIILQKEFYNESQINLEIDDADGIYFIEITAEGLLPYFEKIVKA